MYQLGYNLGGSQVREKKKKKDKGSKPTKYKKYVCD